MYSSFNVKGIRLLKTNDQLVNFLPLEYDQRYYAYNQLSTTLLWGEEIVSKWDLTTYTNCSLFDLNLTMTAFKNTYSNEQEWKLLSYLDTVLKD